MFVLLFTLSFAHFAAVTDSAESVGILLAALAALAVECVKIRVMGGRRWRSDASRRMRKAISKQTSPRVRKRKTK